MSLIAVWLGKTLILTLRLLGKRATSLPGKIALKLAPNLLYVLGRRLDHCVVVTGTNGKTTTSALLAGMLGANEPIIHNREGANLPQGLATAILTQTKWSGRLRRKTALFEIDEATLPLVTRGLPVNVLVVTNVFRDQLDRYGELDVTLDKLLLGITQTEATLIHNGDDPLSHYLGEQSHREVRYFGLDKQHLTTRTQDQMRDGAFCMRCGTELIYDGFFYGQLGTYHCPNCAFGRPQLDIVGQVDGWALSISEQDLPTMRLPLRVRGLYNVYNVLAAVSAARICGLDAQTITAGLNHYEAPLGRMQGFQTNPPAILNLIKNPTGCDSVLQAILAERGPKVICLAINDLAADGRDVSWLWDADFSVLAADKDVVACVTTGYRAEDMALRMKYEGFAEALHIVPELGAGLARAFETAEQLRTHPTRSMSMPSNDSIPVYILATYTALYPTAQWLERKVQTNDAPLAYRTSVS